MTRAVLRRTARVEYESKLSAIAQLPGPVRRSEEPRALLSAGFARRCTPSVELRERRSAASCAGTGDEALGLV